DGLGCAAMGEQLSPEHSETVFRGRVIEVAMKRFRDPEGAEYERDVVEHPGAVGILAHDEELVYLVRQPREAVGRADSLEIPAGTLDRERESPLECARRELAEEVGLAAEHWRQLQVIDMTPGYSDETLTLFEATGLSPASAEPDEDEEIEVVPLPLAELDRALNEIHDAKTLIALLMLRR
ncbi:MAG TPA: NUDIX hydrolase, partial [Solirubrobacterales bacterium]|nr:NUDIX hydrolase [Solirubrobacterales bacterium]